MYSVALNGGMLNCKVTAMSGTKQFVFVGGYNIATAFLTPTDELFVFHYFNFFFFSSYYFYYYYYYLGERGGE